ncbi:MAG: ABC transporter substrate-binding protein [Chloroflexi bacterium]|nr:ABC transporter substrate-binding protein [Chloroflexota bacterium]
MLARNSTVEVCLFMVAVLLATSCAPAAAPTPPPKAAAAQQKAGAPADTPSRAPASPSATVKPAPGQASYGGILTTGLRVTIPHFDTHQVQTIGAQSPFASAYNLLIEYDPLDETKLKGDLAARWEVSADALTYTFLLNEGVKFHNGRTLTSEDVKFNLDRIAFPPRGMLSVRADLFRSVDKIEAPDARTVRITLKRPQPSFLSTVALPLNFIFAPEVIKEKGDMKRDILGTGPFKLQSYTEGVSMRMQRNPDYFVKGRPYLDGVTTYIIVDETARIAALRTKQVLLLPLHAEVTAPQAEALQKTEPRLKVEKKVQVAMIALLPNLQKRPWDDVRVRQAVNLLIDREAAAKVVRAGGHYPGYGYVQPGSPWALGDQELMSMPGFRKPKDQDVTEAKRLLAEAGYPSGFKTTLMASTSVHVKEAAEFSKTELAKAGVEAEIRILETGVYRDRQLEGAFDITAVADTLTDPDPDFVLGELYLPGSARNPSKWTNSEYERLFTIQSMATDAAKRKETVAEMQRILHREAPRTIVTWIGRIAVWWVELKDWRPGISVFHNSKFQDVWLAR